MHLSDEPIDLRSVTFLDSMPDTDVTDSAWSRIELIDKLSVFFVISIITLVTTAFLANTDPDGAVEISGLGKIFFVGEAGLLLYLLKNISWLQHASSLTKVVMLWVPWAYLTNIMLFMEESLISYFVSLSSSLFWCLIYLYFYIIFAKHPHLLKLFTIFFVCITVLSSALYYKIYLIRNLLLVGRVSSINEAYFALMTLPWIFLLKKNLYRFAACGLIAVVVFSSMKRTGLIVLFVSIICYFLVENLVAKEGKIKQMVAPLVALLLLGGLFLSVNVLSNDYYLSRFSSIAEDGGSGRSDIYREVLQIQAESDILNWVIGNGYNTVAQKTSELLSAHNDWQEVLYDYGLIGLFIYIMLHLLLVRKICSLIQTKNQYAPVLAMSYAMFLLMSLTSHLIIYPTYFLYLVALWGAIFAMTEQQQSQELPHGDLGSGVTLQRRQTESDLVPSKTGQV